MSNRFFNFILCDGTITTQSFEILPVTFPTPSSSYIATADPLQFSGSATGSLINLIDNVYKVELNQQATNNWYISFSGSSNPVTASANIFSGSYYSSSMCTVLFDFMNMGQTPLNVQNVQIWPVNGNTGIGRSFVLGDRVTKVPDASGSFTMSLVPEPLNVTFHGIRKDTKFQIWPSGSQCTASRVIVATPPQRINVPPNQSNFGYPANISDTRYVLVGGFIDSASYVATASWALNAISGGTTLQTASIYQVTTSWAQNTLFASQSTFATSSATSDFAVVAGTAIITSQSLYSTRSLYATASLAADFSIVAGTALITSQSLYSTASLSASYATTASFALNVISPLSSSFSQQTISASFAMASHLSDSASYAPSGLSASYALNAGSASFASRAVSSSFTLAAANSDSASFSIRNISSSFAVNAHLADTASYAVNALTSSFALSASNAGSASVALSASSAFNTVSASAATSASYSRNTLTASFSLAGHNADSASYAVTCSYALNANINSASFSSASLSASFTLTSHLSDTASFSTRALSSSFALASHLTDSASLAGTASLMLPGAIIGSVTVIGDTTTNFGLQSGHANAIEIIDSSDTIQLVAPNVKVIGGDMYANNFFGIVATSSYADATLTASFANKSHLSDTASYAVNTLTSSFALAASTVVTSSFALGVISSSFSLASHLADSGSYSTNALSASFALSASNAGTASVALSASWAASTIISGSWASASLSSSFAQTASLAIIANGLQNGVTIYNVIPHYDASPSSYYQINEAGGGGPAQVFYSWNSGANGEVLVFFSTNSVYIPIAPLQLGTVANAFLYADASGVIVAASNTSHSLITASWAMNALTASLLVGTGSWAQTASYCAKTASFALNANSASFAGTSSNNISSSWATNANFASFAAVATIANIAATSSYAISSSVATVSASWASASMSSSYAGNALTSSYAIKASTSDSSSYSGYSLSGSFALTTPTASFALKASASLTSSYLLLTNATANYLLWSQTGINKPTVDVRSVGSKLVLYPVVGSGFTDVAIGLDNNTMWFGVPANNNLFKFYGGTSSLMTLYTGSLSIDSSSAGQTNFIGTASWAVATNTASYGTYAQSSSFALASHLSDSASYGTYAQSSSFALASHTADSSSYGTYAQSASFGLAAHNADSASYSTNTLTASFALAAGFVSTATTLFTASTYQITASQAISSSWASRANTADLATLVSIGAEGATNTTFGVLFVSGSSVKYDPNFSYNPVGQPLTATASWATKAVTATSASNALNAHNASVLNLQSTALAGPYYPIFANSDIAGFTSIFVDSSGTYGYNALTETLKVTNITSTLSGTASWANTASVTPFDYIVSKTLTGSLGGWVGLITQSITNQASNLEIYLTVCDNGFSVAKAYILPSQYSATGWGWVTVAPIADSGPFTGLDFCLEASSSQKIHYRIKRNVGANTADNTVQCHILNYGLSSLTITDWAGTGSDATLYPVSQLQPLTSIGSTGKVGIGTIFPQTTLHVMGQVSASQFNGPLQGTASWASNAITASYSGTASMVITLNDTISIATPVFFGSSSAASGPNQTEVHAPFTYQASTQTLTVKTVVGTASYATFAKTASFALNGSSTNNYKAGIVASASFVSQNFGGNVYYTGSVAFGTVMSDANYAVALTFENALAGSTNVAYVVNKNTNGFGFVTNITAAIAPSSGLLLDWIATAYNNP